VIELEVSAAKTLTITAKGLGRLATAANNQVQINMYFEVNIFRENL